MTTKLVLAQTQTRGRTFVTLTLGVSSSQAIVVTPRSMERARGRAVEPQDVIWVDPPTSFSQEFLAAVYPCIYRYARVD